MEQAKREIVAQPYALAGDVMRMFHADAEDLSEGGIMVFLGKVLPVLRAEGVVVDATFGQWKRLVGRREVAAGAPPGPLLSLRVSSGRDCPMVDVRSELSENSYTMYVGEREFVACESRDGPATSWMTATVATLDILNVILGMHDSSERAWAVMGGNDLHVVFASEEACRFVNSTLAPRDQLHDGTKD